MITRKNFERKGGQSNLRLFGICDYMHIFWLQLTLISSRDLRIYQIYQTLEERYGS